MFLAFRSWAYEVAVFHKDIHAFFKASLFLVPDLLSYAFTREQGHAQMWWIKKSNDNHIYYLQSLHWPYFRYPPFSVFSKDEILMVAFEHNKNTLFIASISIARQPSICLDYYTLLSSKNLRAETKVIYTRVLLLITFPFNCFGHFLATLGGLISLPTNSYWTSTWRLIAKVATEEHHFGTSEYLLMLAAVIGD
jgi:NADH-quinone oxidoreductase subunit L